MSMILLQKVLTLKLVNTTHVKQINRYQCIVESSTYGSELVLGKHVFNLILEYRYMLRMVGARIEESELILGDNNSVVLNITIPGLVSKKSHYAVLYNKI